MYFQAHIGQLVAVQHKRGAQGGLLFTRGLNLGDTGEDGPEESLGRVREASVEQFLHLGTSVRIHHIPDGPHSSLQVQTTVVRAEEGSGDTIPQEYINTFSPFEARVALVEELDTLHDLFKTTLRKHASITNTNFIPVHAVLNGLPKVHYCEITHNFTAQC